ncbi:4-hydroxy-tetrahydrodipicolinate synthase [Methanococcus maripaludis]|uniref:4-hydroxy-tetrahydrodipicolinate synthase n=1 Tax=Methanococcus maripaludis TaxID=39152 RepID=A0A7J9NLV0_METMI|nr:4-hydroxy-tetrahydrodipicolinate synthase [Methanococcus maripaludis]MBA2846384.1 4-hydroxy-tetrahydrodipicolinate synthase [Methanococcus maripaludis]MBA2858522.1 4-hydroxy-tetrahydrodipicolinate synthase [Methanococcus maripaludis]MBG0769799.1 4-hydroxy-tetrahydrodipicolinate synthase [Methanococcus maripaludis]MBM7408558.1 4-hydroxy-tetrahydrodipicolinate synthase [Methanococcus maripaludis]MBP2220133.1 4-hydroxy-tetrahydrodipicolinate synthase [Methanococcus maripaludis]
MQGVYPAIITPLKENKVDYDGLRNNIDFLIENGVNGVIPVGTTGESPTLTPLEHEKVVEKVVEFVDGRVEVIAGTGSNSTSEALEFSQYAEDVGVDGVLLITPYYNKPTQEGLKRHFGEIANSINVPIVLYNVPSRTALNIEPETIKYLFNEYSNISAVKEANPNLSQVSEVLDSCDIDILSGNDELTLPIISLGGKGVVSVIANIAPKEFVQMVDFANAGKFDKAKEIHYKLFPLMKLMFVETNPIPIKTAMNMLGMPSGELRLPLCEMAESNKLKLQNALNNLGLLK